MRLLFGSAGWLLHSTPQGFIPAQDRGYLIVAVQLPAARRSRARPPSCSRSSEMALDTPGVLQHPLFAGIRRSDEDQSDEQLWAIFAFSTTRRSATGKLERRRVILAELRNRFAPNRGGRRRGHSAAARSKAWAPAGGFRDA